jgi:NAD+ diphosphatase
LGVDVRGLFVGAVDAPESPTPLAWWFAFAGDRLIVQGAGDEAEVPYLPAPDEVGLAPEARHYLGMLDGRDAWALDLGTDVALPLPDGFAARPLRTLYGQIDDDLFSLGGRAVQIVEWGRNHRFCGRCGAETAPIPGERAKRCPACGLSTYPRLSPAIIVRVTRGDEILLARNARFPATFFSVLAGFVEPGESLEGTVRRELQEEVAIAVRDIRYFASQPWPFPNSLMIGFTAEWAGGEVTVDQSELAEAGWFTVATLPSIPGKPSIARLLIDDYVSGHSGRVDVVGQ